MADALAVARFGGPLDLARHADHDAAGGDFGVFGHDGAHADDATGADPSAIHDDGPHPDQHVVFDGGAVDDGRVAQRDAIAQRARDAGIGVQHAQILDVRLPADADLLPVAADHGVEPDAGLGPDQHLADQTRAHRDERGGFEQFGMKVERVEHEEPRMKERARGSEGAEI